MFWPHDYLPIGFCSFTCTFTFHFPSGRSIVSVIMATIHLNLMVKRKTMFYLIVFFFSIIHQWFYSSHSKHSIYTNTCNCTLLFFFDINFQQTFPPGSASFKKNHQQIYQSVMNGARKTWRYSVPQKVNVLPYHQDTIRLIAINPLSFLLLTSFLYHHELLSCISLIQMFLFIASSVNLSISLFVSSVMPIYIIVLLWMLATEQRVKILSLEGRKEGSKRE